jgi:hypothetical protein
MRWLHWASGLFAVILLLSLYNRALPILHKNYHLPIHKTLYIDRSFPQHEGETIIQAAMEWSSATNGLVNYTIRVLPQPNIDPNNSIIIVRETPDFPEIILMDSLDGTIHLGYYRGSDGVPYIALVSDRLEEENYKAVVLHELGHSLGLLHTDKVEGIGTLMYHNIGLGSHLITDTDLHNFCRLYGCNADNLHDQ